MGSEVNYTRNVINLSGNIVYQDKSRPPIYGNDEGSGMFVVGGHLGTVGRCVYFVSSFV